MCRYNITSSLSYFSPVLLYYSAGFSLMKKTVWHTGKGRGGHSLGMIYSTESVGEFVWVFRDIGALVEEL